MILLKKLFAYGFIDESGVPRTEVVTNAEDDLYLVGYTEDNTSYVYCGRGCDLERWCEENALVFLEGTTEVEIDLEAFYPGMT